VQHSRPQHTGGDGTPRFVDRNHPSVFFGSAVLSADRRHQVCEHHGTTRFTGSPSGLSNEGLCIGAARPGRVESRFGQRNTA
jgi:hypothetical protein